MDVVVYPDLHDCDISETNSGEGESDKVLKTDDNGKDKSGAV